MKAIDFGAGGVEGVVIWNDAPVSGLATQGMIAGVWGLGGTGVNVDGSYALGSLPPGNHTLRLNADACDLPGNTLLETNVTVTAGVITPVNLDITATAGRVIGSISVNGSPVAWPDIHLEGPCGASAWGSNDQGSFAHFLAPGTYTARVAVGSQLGTFSFPVSAGQTTNLGAVDFGAGGVQGVVTWNGAPVSGLATQGMIAGVWGLGGTGVNVDGSYALGSLPPGNHTLRLNADACDLPGNTLLETNVTVTTGATTPVNLDITATAGRVIGSISVNGSPVAWPDIHLEGPCGASPWGSNDQGSFEHFLAPGTYTARVAVGSQLGTFSFPVSAGQTTNLGAVDFGAGSVQGVVTWNGAPVSGLATQGMIAGVWGLGGTGVNVDGSYALGSLPPGNHTMRLNADACDLPGNTLLETNVAVTAGVTTPVNLDITATAGRVIGSISVNGSRVAWPDIHLVGPCGASPWGSNDQGSFAHFLAPGTYTARVFVGAQLGTFDFSVLAGRTTNVDSLTGPFPSDPHVDLLGGTQKVNGLSLDFTKVDQAGSTVVVESGSCAHSQNPCSPPPSGYEVVGARYWNIDTTARYSGAIQVCIHYDVEELCGKGRTSCQKESMLRLLHDDGVNTCLDAGGGTTPWCNITASTDVVRKMICGSTSSLSPFAVVAPVGPPNTPPTVSVPAGMLVEASGPAGAVVSFDASAADAEEGALVPTCAPASGSTFPIGTTTVTCTASDSDGGSGSDRFTITVRDATPPAFAGGAANIAAYATSAAGAAVSYAPLTATDTVSGSASVICTPAPGAMFAPGKTDVSCTATDAAGNASTATFKVWVQFHAPADGTFFLKPIRPDGSSRFKIGRAVPVKFQLSGASAGITNLAARLTVTRISDAVRGTTDCDGDEDGEDTDMLFKYRKAKALYGYRWKTRGEAPGTYRLRADLGDDVTHEIDVSLRTPK